METYQDILKKADSLTSVVSNLESEIERAAQHSDGVSALELESDALSQENFRRRVTKRYIQREVLAPLAPYLKEPDRIPLQFDSNAAAVAYVRALTHEHKAWLIAQGMIRPNSRLKEDDAAEILMKSRLAMTAYVDRRGVSQGLLIYDYDRRIYSNDTRLIEICLTDILGVVKKQSLSAILATLEANAHNFAVYNPPKPWQLPVANGVLNLLTLSLDVDTPLLTVMSRVSTPYDPNVREPTFNNNMTFEKLIDNFAGHDPRRVKLVMQVMKSALIGHAPVPTFVQIIGPGGDGKSTLMNLLTNIIGSENVSPATVSDLGTDDGLRSLDGMHLNIGMDNGESFIRPKTSEVLKKVTAGEFLLVARKYLNAAVIVFRGVIIQVSNKPFRFADNTAATYRRVITIEATNNYYDNGTVDRNIESMVVNEQWHKYILKYLIENVPFFTDFEDIDREVLVNTLDADDPIGSFCAELAEEGVLSALPAIHVRLAYAAYSDWHTRNANGGMMHSSRSFTTQFVESMKQYGYKLKPGRRCRIKNVEAILKVSFEDAFGIFANGDAFRSVYDSNSVGSVVERASSVKIDRIMNNTRRGKRDSRWCDAYQYFKLSASIDADVSNDYMAYFDIIEEMLARDEYSIITIDTRIIEEAYQQTQPLSMYLDDNEDEMVLVQDRSRQEAPTLQYLYDSDDVPRAENSEPSLFDDSIEDEIHGLSLDELKERLNTLNDESSNIEIAFVLSESDSRLDIDTSDYYDIDMRIARLKLEFDK